MSIPENELDLDKLFLPAWAQEPASANLYAKYEGGEGPRDRDRRGPRPPRRDGPPRDRGDRGPRRDGRREGQGPRPGPRSAAPGGPGTPAGERGRGPRRDHGRGPSDRFNE